jgi:hypothetical protein
VFQPPPSTEPFIVTIWEEPAREITLADVVYGSLGLVGLLLLLALALGTVLAFLILGWRRRNPPEDDHLPPVVPVE